MRTIFTRFLAVAALGAVLAGCATSALDQLNSAEPTGTPFTQELFKNYQILARSFASDSDEDSGGFFGMFSSNTTPAGSAALANAFAAKALSAAGGTEVDPEPAIDAASQGIRSRLVRAVGAGKDKFPRDAARAQADYDCWILNSSVAAQAEAAATCKNSLNNSLLILERDVRPAPSFTPPPPPPTSDYTVLFEFDSWTLTAEDLAVLTQAINTARAGGQSRITIVGHTDTSGDAGYNMKLSEKRATVVKEALVDMGARREAIQTSGVGESDLAVPTPDGVKEPRNRRAVVNLLP